MSTISIGDLVPNDNNPRKITGSELNRLKESIKGFERMMEMRPIIIDEDNVILGGNQRYKALVELGYAEIPQAWVSKHEGLSEDQKREFIIRDNVSHGEFDFEDFEITDFEVEEWTGQGKVKKMGKNETVEIYGQSIQIEPPDEYIVIKAKPNSEEWEELKKMLRLNMVRRGGYKKGSPFESVGLERVLEWSDLKKRLGI